MSQNIFIAGKIDSSNSASKISIVESIIYDNAQESHTPFFIVPSSSYGSASKENSVNVF